MEKYSAHSVLLFFLFCHSCYGLVTDRGKQETMEKALDDRFKNLDLKVTKMEENMIEIEELIRNRVALNCLMTPWTAWSLCSQPCGIGHITRSRRIIEQPENGGRECGDLEMMESCDLGGCPVNGKWAYWGHWSMCNGGSKERRRTCTGPPPSNGGSTCPGPDFQQDTCVNGMWAGWGNWSSCNGGSKERRRTCTAPPPSNNGSTCPGPDIQQDTCGFGESPDIVYKYTDEYELIWKDKGSGGLRDVAIWGAKNYQSGYFSLGDVAVDNYEYPDIKTVLVTAKKPNALVPPSSFIKVWDDAGSGADWDAAVYMMEAPKGFTCLGAVAMRHHSNLPDSGKYCCIKDEYVVSAGVVQVYNDGGTGSHKDLSLWTVIRAGNPFGVLAGNFIPIIGYSEPKSVYLLEGNNGKVMDAWSISYESKPLNLYEIKEMKEIWNDAGSGANADCSIWRPEVPKGYYAIGDIAVATHSKPNIAFVMRPTTLNDGSFQAPTSYTKIWSDAGSGAKKDVTIWKANCPAGYVALGNVATSGSTPVIGDIYCLKFQYTSSGGSWKYVWRDHGSGARRDVTIWEATLDSKTTTLQPTRGMGTIASHRGKPGNPFLLKKDMVTYRAEKPISKVYLSNVVYDLMGEKKLSNPTKMSPTNVQNNGNKERKAVRTLTYETSQESSFTFSQAITVGISMEVSAGIPMIGEATTTLSAETTSTFEVGTTTTLTKTDSITAEITIPAYSQTTAFITAQEYKADIPFTATIVKVYYDGSEGRGTISGVYKGVQVTEANIQFGEIMPLNGNTYKEPSLVPPVSTVSSRSYGRRDSMYG